MIRFFNWLSVTHITIIIKMILLIIFCSAAEFISSRNKTKFIIFASKITNDQITNIYIMH